MPLIISPSPAANPQRSGAAGGSKSLNAGLKQHTLAGSAYGFSGVRIDDLGASEYTLAVIAADTSSSVAPFVRDIEAVVGAVVQACGRSPRADNLLLRLLSFDDTVTEVHGFRALSEIDPAAYLNTLKARGCTALFDAALNAVASATHYGEQLVRHAFGVNAIVFVITDGCDNSSRAGLAELTQAVLHARHAERLESLATVLIGVNLADATVKSSLEQLARSAGFTQFLALDQADARTLARVADFVSQCVSAQSACLGTGQGPSLPVLTF